jgi:hypothetical protein
MEHARLELQALGIREFEQAVPGPITILAITFFDSFSTYPDEPNAVTAADYTFSFSTTSKLVGGLDLTNLNNNFGVDNQVFFSGALGGPLSGIEFTVTGTMPFTYDPSLGNLLLNISLSNRDSDSWTFF